MSNGELMVRKVPQGSIRTQNIYRFTLVMVAIPQSASGVHVPEPIRGKQRRNRNQFIIATERTIKKFLSWIVAISASIRVLTQPFIDKNFTRTPKG